MTRSLKILFCQGYTTLTNQRKRKERKPILGMKNESLLQSLETLNDNKRAYEKFHAKNI